MDQILLTEKPANIDSLVNPGDFCFIDAKLVMACPVCAGIFYCPHEVVQRSPLTLSPSVVGPSETFRIPSDISPQEQILTPCGHHFWVKDGKALDAM